METPIHAFATILPTVILCHPKGVVDWKDAFEAGSPVRMGEAIADLS